MKKNTCSNDGFGIDRGHEKCPEPMPSDLAKTKHSFCEVVEEIDPADLANDVPTAVEAAVPLVDVLLQVDVEADIHLPFPAREIKNIRKNISLTQCKAIPSFYDPTETVKLFITGVIHKNIQYVDSNSGFVRDYSTDVPFKCVQSVTLENPLFFPIEGFEYSVKNSVLERRQLAKDGHGADRCESGSLTFEIYNEPIKCKLLASSVKSHDIYKDFDNWGRFNRFTEKSEVLLLVKLIQKQQISTALGNAGAAAEPGTEAGAANAGAPTENPALEKLRRIFGRMQ
ncbi:hypothetical protein H1D32_11295 [Anaerobacillus sp. CMMVII]|uniref:CsxC family protein n=1 Tax=Anaerobacillus sp. CMMVII TaxID=2755588 RepID=UPI0021B7E996|nr:hypothetical protein [Anaerobacillus sp. CMMVII]MCT8138283.1 hypothetical protein [Anaerobacillus sp. CMMVII]